ncbi:SGNH/GDSL hydrolase family protein [Paenibacillus eucommiae]|uniref:Lysophospholipase L1-like esterase n=1 Tax=Paenibacillus eucommiae TaxID=1355755 RepID=A0ABS4IMQ9_9BACL|nr:SGNH/GDSL hydrolase family protein [Paenibacillus eucommiae]MBP1988851.1 lysophospholipase L1-like esterase [Paenibacillus eucommiae]
MSAQLLKLKEAMSKQESFTIITYGDSWTFGSVAEGYYPEMSISESEVIYGSWAEQLKRFLQKNNPNVDFRNQGVPGWQSVQGAEAFDERVLAFKPDCIILNFGINDWKNFAKLEQFQVMMEQMIMKSKQSGCMCLLWISGPLSISSGETYGWHSPIQDQDFPHAFSDFTETLYQLADKHKLLVADAQRDIIDLWESGTDLSGWFYDAIHFTQKGHDRIFESLKRTLSM